MSKNFIINNLVSSLQKLPSIGQRTAKRIVLSILQNKDEIVKPLMESLSEAYNKINKCKVCGNYTTGDVCEICSNEQRDRHVMCVVESIADLWAIENTNMYNGLYHILDGTLSAIEGRGVEVLKLNKLRDRIIENDIKEVIIATNPTLDGQTTAFYVVSNLEEYNLKITRPSFGVPMGSELNNLDDDTLSIAFKNKGEF
ncbi:MAG: recombination mediator RecR [Rickettsiales bacterium]|jgi:recombination protein RecR|nr:recombination mediator RecR [Rickettsiales bacterium]